MFITDFLVDDEADIQAEGAAGIGHEITLLKKRWGHSSTAVTDRQADFV